MNILVADDDPISRTLVCAVLAQAGHACAAAADGEEAWQALQAPGAPALAVLDWMMPHRTGVDVCRSLRAREGAPPYVILLTSRHGPDDIVAALDAGADDYITKPFDAAELRARVGVGVRILALQQALATRVIELEAALANVKQLRSMLPMCAWCRRVRNDADYWEQIESYLTEHSGTTFSHGICPDCAAKVESTQG